MIPSSWTHFLIYLISKSIPGKYRPISLTSCILKILERLISLRLDWWLEHYLKLPNSQFGFRKFRSCNDNLAILSTEINTSFLRKMATASLFLDFTSAFDNVIPQILVEKCEEIGLPFKFNRFIANLIQEKNIQFIINGGISSTYKSYKGVPQGSILSPTLFNIYLARIRKAINKECEIL